MAIQLGLTSHDQSHDQSHDPEAIIPLVGCHCVQLLHYIPDGSLSDFALFLAGLLNEELSEVPRGVVYTALRQAEVPTRLERIVSSIPEKLCSMCTTHCSRDTAAGVIRGNLGLHSTSFQNSIPMISFQLSHSNVPIPNLISFQLFHPILHKIPPRIMACSISNFRHFDVSL